MDRIPVRTLCAHRSPIQKKMARPYGHRPYGLAFPSMETERPGETVLRLLRADDTFLRYMLHPGRHIVTMEHPASATPRSVAEGITPDGRL